MKKAFQLFVPVIVILAMMLSFVPAHPVQAVSADIVISQVYGGGGNSGGIYTNDYVELYNLSASTVSLAGWSIQYTSATSTGLFGSSSTAITPLSGSIAPGQYLLVQEAAGANIIASLPSPDVTDSTPINMSGTGGKVALVNTTTPLGCNGSSTPCTPAALATIVDLVGWDGANFYEGAAAAPATTNSTAVLRINGGCTDTDNNSADFTAGTPTPRNSASPYHYCSGPTNPSAIGTASPNSLFVGDPVLLTLALTLGTNPPSTGLAATCDLSSIGGSATQAFFDDATNGDVTAGDKTFSISTTVVAGTTGGAKTLPCSITDAESRTGNASISLTVTEIIPIGTVNGTVSDTEDATVHRSPFAPATGNGAGTAVVTVQGVIYEKTLQAISNSTNTYKGFFIQNTSATADADPNTSDGLFVFMSTFTTMIGGYVPLVGDEVIISGKVTEFFNMTELSSASLVQVVRSGVDIGTEVAPVVANPPLSLADANRYWERLQGMRVQVPQDSVVLGGRNVFSPADAEVWVAAPDNTVAQRTNPFERRAFRDANPLDDNYDPTAWDGNGYRILMGSLGIKAAATDAQALIDPARTFDTVTNAPAGGINYSFSKYRVEISEQPAFNEGVDPATNNAPTAIADRSTEYSIVDYNLENLYDYRDNPFSGCDFTGNAGCPITGPFISAIKPPYDYVPASDVAYQARLNDIALQIISDLHSPDILMVQEVENQDICTVTGSALTCGDTDNADGKPDVLQELALKVASNGGPVYDGAFDRDSSDLRGIAPAYLYRTDRVQLLPPAGDPILGTAPAIIYAGAGVPANADVSNPKTLNAMLPAGVTAVETSWVFPRAPGIALFRVFENAIGDSVYSDVYVINNHFKSGPDTAVAHRTEQAKYNAALVAYIESVKPNARIVMGGDLNVYPRPDDIALGATDQLGSLYNPDLGLKNLWEVLLGQAPEAAYSYVFLGMAQTLDQMFVNPLQLGALSEFRIAHINSDFPADYPGDVARGTSDHDPNVATFKINQPPTADAGGPYSVDEGSTVTLTATGTDPENGSLGYAWDLDNDGSFETAGQSVSFTKADGPSAFPVNAQVTDNGGLTAVASTTVTVNNVAPTVGTISAPIDPVLVKTSVGVSVDFTDPGILDTHTALIDWGDGSTSEGLVVEIDGSGSVTGDHKYNAAGLYHVTITVTDKDGGFGSSTFETVIVYNPNGGFLTGSGWFTSPEDGYKAKFDVVAKYKKGATVPEGATSLLLSDTLNFTSTSYGWMVIVGKTAYLSGTGTINGEGEYSFLITEVDDSPDKIQIKIWDANGVVYDTLALVDLGGGNITVK